MSDKKNQEQNKDQQKEQADVKQIGPKPAPEQKKQARFIGTVVKLNDRTEEVVNYAKGRFTINYAPYYLEATDTQTGVITRLPYTSIHFIKEVTR